MASSHYDTLGVEKNATATEIKYAYRKLAREHHPDKSGDADEFKKVQEAYEWLSDDDKRNQYDFELENKQNNMTNAFGVPENVLNFFKAHMENAFFNSSKQNIPNIDVVMMVTLIDVCHGNEHKVDFERLAFIDPHGSTVKLPQLATQICSKCHGNGNEVHIANNGFFVQQTVAPCSVCSGEGYVIINGCKLIKRKCRFKHNLQKGTLDGETFIFEHEGDIIFDKKSKRFVQGHVVITIKYDISATNKALSNMHPNISIKSVSFGDILYEYDASIFEFITGTKFNVPLPNGRIMLVIADSLDEPKTILKLGLPQIVDKASGAIELRNIIISFKVRPLDKKYYVSDSDKIILRRIMAAQYPKVVEQDAILVDYSA
jgi:DnaJ-class molecular chaperone